MNPRALLPRAGDRIMSLLEPEKKMSKTGNSNGFIGVFEEPAAITEKIMAAKTDTGKEITFNAAKNRAFPTCLQYMRWPAKHR